jgi:hypothetical protein
LTAPDNQPETTGVQSVKTNRFKAAAAIAAGLLVLGGGAALATNLASDPSETSREILERAAEELGVESERLSDALKAAAIEQIEEALDAGDITEGQAESLRERLESSDFPLLGGPAGFGHRVPRADR